jgi:2-iminobutanoate/2-iminopropanoate deaminase
MERRSIQLTSDTSRGMAALGGAPAVFSDAVRVELGDATLLYISGKMALDTENRIVGRTMREQTRQVLENIKAVLDHEGGTMDDIVRVRVFVTELDPALLKDIHAVRAEYFAPGRYPASTLVKVSGFVRDGGLIEIEADAVLSR